MPQSSGEKGNEVKRGGVGIRGNDISGSLRE